MDMFYQPRQTDISIPLDEDVQKGLMKLSSTTNLCDNLPGGFIAAAKQFHYDTAGAANRGALVSLRELVGPSQIVFGTDFPPGGTTLSAAQGLAGLGLFSAAELQGIGRDNAVRLLPRFGQ